MKTATLIVRVQPETKALLAARAMQHGLTESIVLRRLIDAGLNENVVETQAAWPTEAWACERKKIAVTIPAFIERHARERANQKGMSLSGWVSNLIQSHLLQPPVSSMMELKVLNESNRQIRAMGVNINQIARAFNNMEIDIRKLRDFDVVERLLHENLNVIEKLIRVVNRSWGVGRGNH